MILAENEKGEKLAFENIQEVNMANRCGFGKWKILKEENKNPMIDDIKVEVIKPKKEKILIHKDELKEYSVKSFIENINKLTDEELETFSKFDERKTVSNGAKKELKRRNR